MLILLIIILFGFSESGFALWFPGKGVLWVQYMTSTDPSGRYISGNYYGKNGYKDSATDLYWATNNQISRMWASNPNYREPVWDGVFYIYPSGRIATDYPAFNHCTALGAGWRLPSKKELLSIVNIGRTSPVTSMPGITGYEYWTADEHLEGDFVQAELVVFGYFYSAYTLKSVERKVICVHD